MSTPKDTTNAVRTFTLAEIKQAFWSTFHGKGELFFPYPSMGMPLTKCDAATENEWQYFVDELIAGKTGDLATKGLQSINEGRLSLTPENMVIAVSPLDIPVKGWQPIETAPKDGSDVLVYFDCAAVPVVHIAWYRSREEWETSGQYCGGWDSLEEWEGWWSYTRNSVSQEKLEGFTTPTHWMPLLEAPNAIVSGLPRKGD